MEAEAVEDARRLAAKVQRQQRELHVARDRIADLEERLRQYRIVLGVDASVDGPCPTGSGCRLCAKRESRQPGVSTAVRVRLP
jgi:hypothetical protein